MNTFVNKFFNKEETKKAVEEIIIPTVLVNLVLAIIVGYMVDMGGDGFARACFASFGVSGMYILHAELLQPHIGRPTNEQKWNIMNFNLIFDGFLFFGAWDAIYNNVIIHESIKNLMMGAFTDAAVAIIVIQVVHKNFPQLWDKK